MERLLRLNGDLGIGDLTAVLRDLRGAVDRHRVFLASKHAGGDQFTSRLLANVDELFRAADQTEDEQAEVDQALSERTALYEEARAHLLDIRAKVRLVADAMHAQSPSVSRQILRDYGLRGSQLRTSRNSHVERLLGMAARSHVKHGDLLQTWGNDAAWLERAGKIVAGIPGAAERLSKERAEAEAAVERRDQLEAEVVREANLAIRIVEAHQDSGPQVLADFRSVLNKYRDLLQPGDPGPPEDEASEPEGPVPQ